MDMTSIPENLDALLTRDRLAEALTEAGYPTKAKTLATKASRGGGPPYRTEAIDFRGGCAAFAAAPPQQARNSMTAAGIAVALGDARREGRDWRCRCPLHQGRSLTLRDGDGGSVLVTCWGGCDRLDVLAELRRRGLLDGRTTDYAGASPRASQRQDVARTA